LKKKKMSRLYIYLCDENSFLPTRATLESAGVDLKIPKDAVIGTENPTFIELGIRVIIPRGCYGRIAPRSGATMKYGITIGAGVIDRDYQGTLGVVIFNHTNKPIPIPRGTAIAQLICEKCDIPEVIPLAVWEPEKTTRGEKGFGSSDL
jgi:dUTP pyrophosphatase